MKKHLLPPDSLELLLDAMCNIFGAVLLLAIVLGGVTTGQKLLDPEQYIDAQKLKAAQQELVFLQTQLKNLQLESSLLTSLPPPDTATGKTDNTLQERYRAAAQTANQLADNIERSQQKLRQLHRERQLLANADRPGSTQALQTEISQLKKSLQQLPGQPGQLPLAVPVKNRQPWRLLLTAQKLFLIGSNQQLRTAADTVGEVTVKRFSAHGHTFYRLNPLPDKGHTAENFQHSLPRLLPDDRQNYFIEILATPDAVALTAQLLEILRQNQWSYFWRIVPDSGAILRTAERSNYEAQI